ncbi:hypothetical protein TpMuguga_03g00459 [Theileria parva strain Muguga]|uniref:Uncharacterized protein n=1 Tax=Theileria parva TaxID=5875 RepID=Q4N0Y6_THEPA|nr:uncharacterized protein TpMuguga_03g00459 [Theileria parva strain Muguga]EAN31196.1 hypothetical protein TpMuguga_03g00459 [Theileria parva strain Muguga]|eukprot:XP_763479.1 hypothetical protein [Theileria parva strain Muguga]
MSLFKDRKICKLLANADKINQEGYKTNLLENNIYSGSNSGSVERYSAEDEKNKLGSNDSISSCMTQVSIKHRNDEVQTDPDSSGNNSEGYKRTNKSDDSTETKLLKKDEDELKSERSSKLIIFDYDDTILPTYSLTLLQKPRFTTRLTEEALQGLEKLSDAVLDNLNTALNIGTIVIVTNASSEWVSQSVDRYLPRVGEFLIKHKIRIISARDRFGNSMLAQKHWKYFIFIDLIEEQFIRQLKTGDSFSLISIGDGSEEREACMKLVGIFKNQGWTFKNLKFLNQPSYNCLTLEHILLQKSFKNFIDIQSSADLCIQFDKVNS